MFMAIFMLSVKDVRKELHAVTLANRAKSGFFRRSDSRCLQVLFRANFPHIAVAVCNTNLRTWVKRVNSLVVAMKYNILIPFVVSLNITS